MYNSIFLQWDKAREKRKGQKYFRLKEPPVIHPKDTTYEVDVKNMVSRRCELRLSAEDLANGLGITRTTLTRIESFNGKESPVTVWAALYLMDTYEVYLINKESRCYSGMAQ